MIKAKTGIRVLSLLIAALYFIFSCLYVTRCPNYGQLGTKTYCSFTSGIAKLSSYSVSKHKNTKSLPIAFLSRPRVIFSKNIVVLLKAHFTRLSTGPLKSFIYKIGLKSACFSSKALQSDKIFSVFRSWRIWSFCLSPNYLAKVTKLIFLPFALFQ